MGKKKNLLPLNKHKKRKKEKERRVGEKNFPSDEKGKKTNVHFSSKKKKKDKGRKGSLPARGRSSPPKKKEKVGRRKVCIQPLKEKTLMGGGGGFKGKGRRKRI